MAGKMTWWRVGLDTGLALMTLSTAAPWDPPKGHKHRIYASDDFEFHESEIDGHFDEIEEQLFAFRNGLSNVVYDITLSPRISKKLLRYLRKKRPAP